MALKPLCLIMAIALCSAQDTSSAVIPAKVLTTTDDSCPTESQRSEVRRQLNEEVLQALAQYTPASSCSDLPADSPSGYYWIRPVTDQPAVASYNAQKTHCLSCTPT